MKKIKLLLVFACFSLVSNIFSQTQLPMTVKAIRTIPNASDGSTYRLGSPKGIVTEVINGETYALVVTGNGVKIINISTPASPSLVSTITDEDDDPTDDDEEFTTLSATTDISTIRIGAKIYALVTSYGDNGVQIIDITTPSSPIAVAAVTDGATYTTLNPHYSPGLEFL